MTIRTSYRLEKDIKRQAPKPIYVNPNPNHQEIVKEIEARVNEIEDPDNAGTHFNFQVYLYLIFSSSFDGQQFFAPLLV